MQGRLIVFEGTDGSGKATQTALLCRELDRRGVPYRRLEFPRYQEESSALIRLYLSGAFGSHPGDVNAYAAAPSIRWTALPATGRIGAVLRKRRAGYCRPLHHLQRCAPDPQAAPRGAQGVSQVAVRFEYRLLELPKPDRVVYLDLPTEISEEMMRRREEKTHTQADIHERDEAYLAACRESAELIITLCGWEKIDCSRDGQIRSPEDIHREVLARVEDLLVP